ncbi:Pycsar system effector family protein [Streptomyces sp. NPDC050636]|uniref:Pycsar system effector family protein n=1 Tax=Streptomyces sp. NPDC050636 TaxID=3154510 RepID=UPI0034221763
MTTGPSTAAPPTAGTATGIRLLEDLRGEIARADSKASVLVGALGMTAGLLGGVLTARGWRPSALPAPAAAAWWLGAGALIVSLVALLMAVLPRYRTSHWQPGQPVAYFGDIQRAAEQHELARALADTERDPTAALINALMENSRIVGSKHRWIRIGLGAFCAGSLLLPGAFLLG